MAGNIVSDVDDLSPDISIVDKISLIKRNEEDVQK
jgi:hypothetical protein